MSYRYPWPYVPGTLLAIVGGTVQPAIDVDPADPAGGTFELDDDPEDMTVRVYAQISPDVIPAPVTPEGEEDEDAVLVDEDDDYEEDEPLVDAEDDEEEEDDPDAPELPDD